MADKRNSEELQDCELDAVQGAGFGTGFVGGVRVATGDIDNDGNPVAIAPKGLATAAAGNPTAQDTAKKG